MTREPELPLWELIQTAHVVTRRFTEVFAEAGLTPAQFGVLACLADVDDLSQADLARVVLVRPQSMGRLINAMIDRGLVERVGPGGRGRRSGLLVTTAGRRAVEVARPTAYAINVSEAIGLTSEEAAVLISHLRRIRMTLSSEHTVEPDSAEPASP